MKISKNKIINVNKVEDEKIVLKEPGKYYFIMFNYSGILEVVVDSPNVDVNIFGLYRGEKTNSNKIKTVQDHRCSSSKSHVLIKGIFKDKTSFSHTGLIKIDKDLKDIETSQKNVSIVQSSSCHVRSFPFLEIKSNDVKCSHSSTIGETDKDQLLYLKSRGLNYQKSLELIHKGFFFSILDEVKEESMKKEVRTFLLEKLYF